MRAKELADLQVGDEVRRTFGVGGGGMELKVTGVTDNKIICGAWEFCRFTGAEIDEDLDWGPPPKRTGSVIILMY